MTPSSPTRTETRIRFWRSSSISPKEYHRQKNIYFVLSILFQITFFLVAASMDLSRVFHEPVYFVVLYAALQTVLWPIRFLSGHRLERKYGLSKQTFASWSGDTLKGQVLGLAVFVAGAWLFYVALRHWPSDWWWILALAVFALSAFFSTVFPVWVLPLFYRSTPLAEPSLEERCRETLERCGLPPLPFFKLHLGQKTVRANAALAGFGPTRRVLLADTLLSGYTCEEVQMVVAHEIGHHVRKHILRSLLFEFFLCLAGFFVLFEIWPTTALNDPATFPVLMIVVTLANLLALPGYNLLSRAHEKEADRFALGIYPDGGTFKTLMEKLADQNMADPEPSRWEEFVLYSHPSKRNRLRHAENFLKSLAKSKAKA